MSTIKRKVNGEWVNILATPATQVFTSNPVLGYPEGTDIEQLFMYQQAEIDLLKKNVSWLALHGGGGSGGGGWGGGSGAMTLVFLNPGNTLETISNLTWAAGYTGIPMRISATGQTGTFTVDLFVDGVKVTTLRNKKRNEVFWVEKAYFGITANQEASILISGTVTNSEGTTGDPTSLSVAFPTLKLYVPNNGETLKYALSDIEGNKVQTLSLQFQCNLPGEYKIFYSRGDMRPDSKNNICVNGIPLTNEESFIKFPNAIDPSGSDMTCPPYVSATVINSGISSISMPLITQPIPSGSDNYYHGLLNRDGSNTAALAPGTYTYSFILQNSEELGLMSTAVTQTFAIVTSTVLTVSPVSGAEQAAPVTVNQQARSKISFILYCEGIASADYRVFISLPKADGTFDEINKVGALDDGEWVMSSATPSMVTSFELTWEEMLVALNTEIEDGVLDVVIQIECRRNGIYGQGYMYVRIQAQTSAALQTYMAKLSRFCVFDFTPWYTMDKFFLDSNEKRTCPGVIKAFLPSIKNNIYTYASHGVGPNAIGYGLSGNNLNNAKREAYLNYCGLYAGDTNYESIVNGNFFQVPNTLINSVAQLRGYNIGLESGRKTLYYSLQHHAYAVISPGASEYYNVNTSSSSTFNNWFNKQTNVSSQNAVFPLVSYLCGSIEIAYFIENTIADDLVIMQIGYDVINSDNANEFGFIITPHKIMCRMFGLTATCVPVDDSFNHIVLTWDFESGTKSLKLYYNGKLAGIQLSSNPIANPTETELAAWNRLFMGTGCSNPLSNNPTPNDKFINVDIYTIRMFRCPMNYGEVVCAYINNLAAYKSEAGDELNATVISEKCGTNQISMSQDSKEIETNAPAGSNFPKVSGISSIYNFLTGKYNAFATVSLDGKDIALAQHMNQFVLPIVVLETKQWSWTEFTGTNNPGDDPNVTMRYYEAMDGSNATVINGVTLAFQGTSTLGYFIKNVQITMPEGIAFQPNKSYLPESTFVLKADVVDSGHFNNAVIGAYINNIAMTEPSQSKLFDTQVYKIRDTMVADARAGKIPVDPDKAFKANIEGFPILLIIDFYNNDTQLHDIRPVGIYSFNLGRQSLKNQGLVYTTDYQFYNSQNVLTNYTEVSQIGGPMIWKEPQINYQQQPYNTYCFEGAESTSCGFEAIALNSDSWDQVLVRMKSTGGPKPVYKNGICQNVTDLRASGTSWQAYKLVSGVIPSGQTVQYCYDNQHQEYYTFTDTGARIPYNADNVVKLQITPTGYFWSPDRTYASEIFFNNRQQTGATNPDVDTMIYNFNNYICMKFGYNKAGIIREMDSEIPEYEAVATSESDATVIFRQKEGNVTYRIERIQAAEQASISFTNIGFYYVICMLFGLVDSFGKNMQYKAWMTKNTMTDTDPMGDAYWTPAFYDMDTALGLDNTGKENISIDMWDESLIDSPTGAVEFIYGMAPGLRHSFATVYSNKIFGIVTSPVNYTQWGSQGTDCYGPEGENTKAAPYLYSRIWTQLREKYITDVDSWIDEYISKRYANVPELIMNYDYDIKYVSPGNAQFTEFMHGDRINYIRQWLKKRVYFLDSVFGYYHFYYNSSDTTAQYLSQLDGSKLALYQVPYNMSCRFTYDATPNTRFVVSTSQPIIMYNGANSVNNRTYVYSTGKGTISMPANATGGEAKAIQGWLYNMPLVTSIDFKKLGPISISPLSQSIKAMGSSGSSNGDKYPTLGTSSYFYSNYGNFQSIRTLDWSSLQTFDTNTTFSFFELFKTWDSSNIGKLPGYAQLEKADLSNVNMPQAKIDFGNISLPPGNIAPENYVNLFKNLISINLSNAKIMSVSIPGSSTLTELSVTNSSITELTLQDQPLLTNLNFTGCKSLKRLVLKNVAQVQTVTLGAECESLTSVSIESMPSLKSVTLVGGENRSAPVVVVKDCPQCTTITMEKFMKDNGNEDMNNTDVTIQNCPGLTGISFYKSKIYNVMIMCGIIVNDDGTTRDATFAEAYPKLKTMDFSWTNVKRLLIGGDSYANAIQSLDNFSNLEMIDLRNIRMCNNNSGHADGDGYKPVTSSSMPANSVSVSFANNTYMTNLHMSNNQNAWNESYCNFCYNCTKLEHIYGCIKGTQGFHTCSKLTLYSGPGDYLSVKADDILVAMPNGGYRAKYATEFGSAANKDQVTDAGVPFNSTPGATDANPNTRLNVELTGNTNAMFHATRCAWCAIYLVLWGSPNVTHLYSTFSYGSDPFGIKVGVSNEKVNNKPLNNPINPYMFKRNTELQVINATFRDRPYTGFIPIKSPILNSNDGLANANEKGLFGWCPELTEIRYPFLWTTCVIDQNVFARNTKLTDLDYCFHSFQTINDVNTYFFGPNYPHDAMRNLLVETNWQTGYWSAHKVNYGNMSGIFRNCPNLTNVTRALWQTKYVNWDSIDFGINEDGTYKTTHGIKNRPLGLTSKINTIEMFWVSSRGCGNVNLKNLGQLLPEDTANGLPERVSEDFVRNVRVLKDSFTCSDTSNQNHVPVLRFRIVDENNKTDYFGLFDKLTHVTYNTTGTDNSKIVPFTGYKKVAVWADIKAKMFGDAATNTLQTYYNMFKDCTFEDKGNATEMPIAIPDIFFKQFHHLENCQNCFNNISFPNHQSGWRLSTGLPFKPSGDKALRYITAMHNTSNGYISTGAIKPMKGGIPVGYLYTGGQDMNVTIMGTNQDFELTDIGSLSGIGTSGSVYDYYANSAVKHTIVEEVPQENNEDGTVKVKAYSITRKYFFKYNGLWKRNNTYFWVPKSTYQICCELTHTWADGTQKQAPRTSYYTNINQVPASDRPAVEPLLSNRNANGLDLTHAFSPFSITHKYFKPKQNIIQANSLFYGTTWLPYKVSYNESHFYNKIIDSATAFEAYITNVTASDGFATCWNPETGSETEWKYKLALYTNPDYSPFNYIYTNGRWSNNMKVDVNKYTFVWSYDGNFIEMAKIGKRINSDKTLRAKFGIPNDDGTRVDYQVDDIEVENMLIPPGSDGIIKCPYYMPPDTKTSQSSVPNSVPYHHTANYRFFCPPDLVRYIGATSDGTYSQYAMQYMFSGCGSSIWHMGNNVSNDSSNYLAIAQSMKKGINGRIPPYLFKDCPKITDTEGMFQSCKMLGGYIMADGDHFKLRIVPEKLFNFNGSGLNVNINLMFAYGIWPGGTDLNVFSGLKGSNVTAYMTFAGGWWGTLDKDTQHNQVSVNDELVDLPRTVTVSYVFNGINVTCATACFARYVAPNSWYTQTAMKIENIKRGNAVKTLTSGGTKTISNITYQTVTPNAYTGIWEYMNGNVIFQKNIFGRTAVPGSVYVFGGWNFREISYIWGVTDSLNAANMLSTTYADGWPQHFLQSGDYNDNRELTDSVQLCHYFTRFFTNESSWTCPRT